MLGRRFKRLFWLFALLLAGLQLDAQTSDKKTELESEKARLQKEISAANELLSKTRKDRDLTQGELRALEKKLKAREALIRNVQAQVRESESEIMRLERDIADKDREIDQMMQEYAGMLRQAQQRGKYRAGPSLYSRRRKPLHGDQADELPAPVFRGFAKRRLKKSGCIKKLRISRVASIEVERNLQKELLGQELRQKQLLAQERALQAKALGALKKKEGQIASGIGKKRQELAKLERQIAAIIKEELRKQRDAAGRPNRRQRRGRRLRP